MKGRKSKLLFTTTAAAIVLLGSIALMAVMPLIKLNGVSKTADPDEVLRLHIIANSDSEEDQQIKLLVRDAVLEYERTTSTVLAVADVNDAEIQLKTNGQDLLNTVRTVLNENEAPYDAQLVIGDFDFPDRVYGDKVYPAGVYRAVRILLGDAEGKNWWCVMFPPLCIVDAKDAEIESSEPIRFESLVVRAFNFIKLHIFGSQEK